MCWPWKCHKYIKQMRTHMYHIHIHLCTPPSPCSPLIPTPLPCTTMSAKHLFDFVLQLYCEHIFFTLRSPISDLCGLRSSENWENHNNDFIGNSVSIVIYRYIFIPEQGRITHELKKERRNQQTNIELEELKKIFVRVFMSRHPVFTASSLIRSFSSLFQSRGQYYFKQKHNEKPEFLVNVGLKATRWQQRSLEPHCDSRLGLFLQLSAVTIFVNNKENAKSDIKNA